MFSDFEPSFTTKLIKERKKKECRGFGFVTVPSDEAAEDFINRYNEKPLVYNGETYKDEEGKDFLLVIEKALPRNKGSKEEGEQQEEAETTNNNQVEANTDNKPSRRNNNNKKTEEKS